jgi:hypothetical protein
LDIWWQHVEGNNIFNFNKMKTKLLNIIAPKNVASFFALAYFYTILMSWGTKDYTDIGFYIVLFQAFFTTLLSNLFISFFGKRLAKTKQQ